MGEKILYFRFRVNDFTKTPAIHSFILVSKLVRDQHIKQIIHKHSKHPHNNTVYWKGTKTTLRTFSNSSRWNLNTWIA